MWNFPARRTSLVCSAILTTLLACPSAYASEPAGEEPAATTHEAAPSSAGDETTTIAVGVDFAPFVGVSSAFPRARRGLSFNVVGGISGGVDALELASALNIDLGAVRGAQLSGGANLVFGDLDAAQLGAGLNLVTGQGRGAQLAGGANVTAGSFEGAQLAGGLNVAGADSAGAQLSGGANVATGAFDGVQLAPFNVAAGGARGVQVGVLNIAGGAVEGVQVGVVNIAASSDVGVGLFNVYWDGFLDLEVVGSEDGLALTGIRHGSGSIYNVYYAGGQTLTGELSPAFGLGLGWRHDLSPSLELSIDMVAVSVAQGSEFKGMNTIGKLRPMLAWRLSDDVAFFGGPTWSVQTVDADKADTDYAPFAGWTVTDADAEARVTMWPGVSLGARFL